MVLERLAKEPNAVLVVRGDLADLPLPQEFACPLPAENVVVASRTRQSAFELNHQSWRQLCSALQEADWLSERLSEMEITIDGNSAFLVGDSFHPECVSLRQAAPKNLSRKLEEAHAASVYRVA
jgi:hypothetical protein